MQAPPLDQQGHEHMVVEEQVQVVARGDGRGGQLPEEASVEMRMPGTGEQAAQLLVETFGQTVHVPEAQNGRGLFFLDPIAKVTMNEIQQ